MSDYLDSLYSNSDDDLSPITAGIGFNDGANKGFWRHQPRKEWGRGKGQWIFMGEKLRALFKINGKFHSVTGRSVGSNGTSKGVRFLPDSGYEHLGIDSKTLYDVSTDHVEGIGAVLPENYVESHGVDVPETAKGTDSVVSTATIPELADMDTAPVTPDDLRLVEQGSDSPEGKQEADFQNTPEGQEIARLSSEAADVATPEEVANLVDGAPAPSKASMFKPATAGWLNKAEEEDVFIEFPGKSKLTPAWVSEGYVYTGPKDNPTGLGSVDEFIEGKKNGSGITIYKGEIPMIDGRPATRQDAIDAKIERINAVYAAKQAKANIPAAQDVTPDVTPEVVPDVAPDVSAWEAVDRAMRGEDPGNLDGLIQAAKAPKKKASSKKSKPADENLDGKNDEEDPFGDGLGDFNPEEDITDTGLDSTSEDPELDGPIAKLWPDTADSLGYGDVFMGPYGEPVRVNGIETDDNGNRTISFTDSRGVENYIDVPDTEEVRIVEFGEPAEDTNAPSAPDSITPEDVTPSPADITEPTPGADSNLPEGVMSVPGDEVQAGDILHDENGNPVAQVRSVVMRNTSGARDAKLNDLDGNPLGGTYPLKREGNLISRPEGSGANEPDVTPEVNTPEPEPTPEPTPAPTPEPTPTPEPETTPPGDGGDGNEPPAGPVDEPGTPDETPAPTDSGEDFAFPADKPDSVLYGKKVSALRDAAGKRVKAIDPTTGEEKSTFAEDPDAILNALLEEYPNAKVDPETGALILARQKFTDPDGSEYTMESRVTRTNGSNYMVSFKVTRPDGSVVEYFHHDFRDSFSSIHGKANGIQRLSAILSGNIPDDFMPKSRAGGKNREWKTYFTSGKFEDRLKFFRGKYESGITRAKLQEQLEKANKTQNLFEIGRAEFHLDLLDREFGGDINKFRDYITNQNMTLLTIEETIDKYSSGRFYVVNQASGRSFGTVMRSAVNGVFGAIRDHDIEGAAQVINELLGRLPDTTKHAALVKQMLDRIKEGAKLRYPDENRNILTGMLNKAFNVLSEQGWDVGVIDQAPHVGWDGRVLDSNMLVEYTNNLGQTSVGVVDSLVPVNKRTGTPNQYNDYVLVRFRNQDGSLSEPAKISSKTLKVLDETGMSDESLKRMTIYTPNVSGEELRLARFGRTFMMEMRAKQSADRLFGNPKEIGDGVRVPKVDPSFYANENAAPGRYMYDKNGLPLGQIAAVRETKSDSGEDGFTIAYVTPEGNLGFVSVKSGEIRAPKDGLSATDGRGTNESDAGFTPDTAAFGDVGLDASSISSEPADLESNMVDVVKNSPMVGDAGSGRLLGKMIAVRKAKAAFQADPSEENKKAYKDALSSYYENLSHMNAVANAAYNRPSTPMQVSGDDLLSPQDIADINGKIRATQMEAEKGRPNEGSTAPLSYDDIVTAASAPELVYGGYTPSGWAPQEVKPAMDFQRAKHAEITKKIVSALGGEEFGEISDTLADALAESVMRHTNTDKASGEYKVPAWDVISNESGDTIRINRNGEPGSKNGYIASDAEIDSVAGVFASLREKLNLGDRPLDFALTRESRAGGALGFVYTADMWGDSAYQARAHLLVDTLPDVKDDLAADKAKGEKFVEGESWWSVDVKQFPERLAEYVAAHEMGHVMQGEALRQFGQNLDQLTWDKFYGPVARDHSVSRYGRSNYNEHFAESFAKWLMTGKANPKFLQFLKDTGLLKG